MPPKPPNHKRLPAGEQAQHPRPPGVEASAQQQTAARFDFRDLRNRVAENLRAARVEAGHYPPMKRPAYSKKFTLKLLKGIHRKGGLTKLFNQATDFRRRGIIGWIRSQFRHSRAKRLRQGGFERKAHEAVEEYHKAMKSALERLQAAVERGDITIHNQRTYWDEYRKAMRKAKISFQEQINGIQQEYRKGATKRGSGGPIVQPNPKRLKPKSPL